MNGLASELNRLWSRYKLRIRRKRLLLRAWRKRRELQSVSRKTGSIADRDVLLFACVRNEALRLPYFLEHYRDLGVGHFLIVDNGSTDGGDKWLAEQPDVSLWRTTTSYKSARFGMDWLTALLWRHGSGHWCVTVDADELLVYPDHQRRGLPELTTWLSARGVRQMGALMLDLYPKGPVRDATYAAGDDPVDVAPWFDAYGYWVQRQQKMGNLWCQGGPRARMFFADQPEKAPTLNKIPLVFWDRAYVYVNSTHNALPASLNQTWAEQGAQEAVSGVLLHTKFLADAPARAAHERERGEHFADATHYQRFYDDMSENPDFWTPQSHRYSGWEELLDLRLMFAGNWLSR